MTVTTNANRGRTNTWKKHIATCGRKRSCKRTFEAASIRLELLLSPKAFPYNFAYGHTYVFLHVFTGVLALPLFGFIVIIVCFIMTKRNSEHVELECLSLCLLPTMHSWCCRSRRVEYKQLHLKITNKTRIKARGLYTIIFDSLFDNSILSSPLFTLDKINQQTWKSSQLHTKHSYLLHKVWPKNDRLIALFK